MKCQEEIDLLRALARWRLFSLVGASADTWLPLCKHPEVGCVCVYVLKPARSNLSDCTHTRASAKSDLCLKNLTETI